MMLSTVPTSTTNITGFFHWMSGRSIRNDCFSAALSRCGANSPYCRLARRVSFSSWGDGPCNGGIGGAVIFVIALTPERNRPQVLRDRAEHSRRQEGQCPEQEYGT